ncbi:hypothetical protein GCK72_007691 [Caenorhabditis remanei]|uniref:Uncharacterized protein n=1 Tax=Caenorhabditis remanei TaxID=31234 RepID=A0A6A5HPJ2_CAERE|nr:hypothetical protein GCK72_007691 [Caenorhabditis remanei]KAF1767732.1 hypothetical protein GCK72_007691 [Caenorhabditis remanei]
MPTTRNPLVSDFAHELLTKGKDKTCRDYVSRGHPEKTENDKTYHNFCCELDNYCKIWAQTWFWLTIGGVILLLILISIGGCVYCCCIRKRNSGGADGDRYTVEEPKEKELAEDLSEEDSSESSCESD